MADVNSALQKFSVGDGLDDDELKVLHKFFENTEQHLHQLERYYDAGFGLARKAALANLQTLESFKHARNREK